MVNVKQVCVCVDPELHKLAIIAGLSWTECMAIGIKVKLNIDTTQEEFEKEERLLKAQMQYLQEKKNGHKLVSESMVKVKVDLVEEEKVKAALKSSGLDKNGQIPKERIAELKAQQKFRSIHAGRMF